MDRNYLAYSPYEIKEVALRKESVDRNYIIKITGTAPRRSLSARRAWIEIKSGLWDRGCGRVALRKESVDRNIVLQKCTYVNMVALRKESVDRNACGETALCGHRRRSPQGERG